MRLDDADIDAGRLEVLIAGAAYGTLEISDLDATKVVEVSALDARFWAPAYLGPYPIRPQVRQALDERYGVGAWTHWRGLNQPAVRYLPVGPAYNDAVATQRGPDYDMLDSKYYGGMARDAILALYRAGKVSQATVLEVFGLEATPPTR